MDFDALVRSIGELHHHLQDEAVKAVNVSLTLRNWLIGWHIAEYELRGEDRGQYGERLVAELAKRLTGIGLSNCNRRQLYRYRDFYRTYPAIVGTLSAQLQPLLPAGSTLPKVGTPSPQFRISPEQLLNSLSYSHLELLLGVENPLKRTFYEVECIKGNWSVRELKRQIASLYYERSAPPREPRIAQIARAFV